MANLSLFFLIFHTIISNIFIFTIRFIGYVPADTSLPSYFHCSLSIFVLLFRGVLPPLQVSVWKLTREVVLVLLPKRSVFTEQYQHHTAYGHTTETCTLHLREKAKQKRTACAVRFRRRYFCYLWGVAKTI